MISPGSLNCVKNIFSRKRSYAQYYCGKNLAVLLAFVSDIFALKIASLVIESSESAGVRSKSRRKHVIIEKVKGV